MPARQKPKANCRIEGIESVANATTIATTMPTTNSATSIIKMRNTASPVFPVGESADLISNLFSHEKAQKKQKAQREEKIFSCFLCFFVAHLRAVPLAVTELIFASARFTMSAGSGAYCKSFAKVSPS